MQKVINKISKMGENIENINQKSDYLIHLNKNKNKINESRLSKLPNDEINSTINNE